MGKSFKETHNAPKCHQINADLMTDEELNAKLQRGYEDIEKGRVENAEKAFAEFK